MGISAQPDVSFVLTPEEPAAQAARLLAARRGGAVPVHDRTGRVVGMVTEHDIVRVVASRALGLRGLAVNEVMTRQALALPPDTPLPETIGLVRHA